MSAKIIKGDKVIILTGKDKGKTGEVSQVFTSTQKATVSGINMVIKHMKVNLKMENYIVKEHNILKMVINHSKVNLKMDYHTYME